MVCGNRTKGQTRRHTRTSLGSLRYHLEHVMHLWPYETQPSALNTYRSLLPINTPAVHGPIHNLKKFFSRCFVQSSHSKYFD